MTDVIDLAGDERWNAWKREGARLDAVRAGRMRKLITTMAVAFVLWLLWRL